MDDELEQRLAAAEEFGADIEATQEPEESLESRALEAAMKMYFSQQLCETNWAVEAAKKSLIEFGEQVQASTRREALEEAAQRCEQEGFAAIGESIRVLKKVRNGL